MDSHEARAIMKVFWLHQKTNRFTKKLAFKMNAMKKLKAIKNDRKKTIQ